MKAWKYVVNIEITESRIVGECHCLMSVFHSTVLSDFPCVSFLLSVCFFFLCLFYWFIGPVMWPMGSKFLTRDWTQAQAVPNPNHCRHQELPTCVFCSVSLLVTDSLTLHLSPNICLSLLLKDIFIGYRILDWLLLFVLILSASVLFFF